MDDATRKAAAPADDSAGAADMTDEQLWDALESENKAEEPAADEPEGDEPPKDAAAGDEAEGAEDPPADDGEPSTSEGDAGDGHATTPDGTDPAALQAQLERLQHAVKSEQGRYHAFREKTRRLESQIAAAEKAPQPTDQDEATLADRKKKLDEVREQYGDVIGPLAEQYDDLKSRFDELTAQQRQDLEHRKAELNALYQAEEQVFQQEHPDGFKILEENAEAFNSWIEDQPKALRDIFAENQKAIVNGNQAALLVGKFKEALLDAEGGSAPAEPSEDAKLQTRRQRQLAGARSSRNSSRQQASSRPAKDSDDPQAHWEYFERQDRGG